MDSRATILFVEDDVNLGFVTKDNLEMVGFQVVHCQDGEMAIQTFENQDFDLCLLDVMLPKLDGFTLAQHIRKKNQEIPIIFLTAKTLKEDRIAGLKIGADDYINKPFSIEELILKIEIFLRRSKKNYASPEVETSIFKIGRYQFNFEELSLVFDGGDAQRLTFREAEVLRLFCQNVNKILPRDAILTNIWGENDYFIGRSLDVFISRLRKYLIHDPTIQIENIHGVGFKLNISESTSYS